mmetsp:Transcript_42104/g.98641  ORF Transcript_42104/g.98641 Transcript_42104/m.98641 type:complete len:674 (-) Transcript_42104:1152-3173(-)
MVVMSCSPGTTTTSFLFPTASFFHSHRAYPLHRQRRDRTHAPVFPSRPHFRTSSILEFLRRRHRAPPLVPRATFLSVSAVFGDDERPESYRSDVDDDRNPKSPDDQKTELHSVLSCLAGYGIVVQHASLPAEEDGGSDDCGSAPVGLSDHVGSRRLYGYVTGSVRRGTLTAANAAAVLDYLDHAFPTSVGNIVATVPRVLRLSVSSQLQPAVSFLRSLYGLDRTAEAIHRNPHLLLVPVGNRSDDGSVARYLQERAGASDRSIEKIRRKHPVVFGFHLEGVVRPATEYILELLGKDGSEKENSKVMSRLLGNSPMLLGLHVEHLEETVTFLRNIGLSEAALRTVLKNCPAILGLSLKQNLIPTVQFLMEEVGLASMSNKGPGDLERCLCRHPQILALSIDNLKDKVDYLNAVEYVSIFGLSSGQGAGGSTNGHKSKAKDIESAFQKFSLVRRVAVASPSVFSLSLDDNIVPTVEYLGLVWGMVVPDVDGDVALVRNLREKMATAGVGGQRGDEDSFDASTVTTNGGSCGKALARKIGEYPPVLTLSLDDNIKPTVAFFARIGYIRLGGTGRAEEEVDAFTTTRKVSFRHVAASLFRRIIPRWHYLKQNVWNKGQDIGPLPPISILVGSTDQKFCDYFKIDQNKYTKFIKDVAPSIQFSAQFQEWIKSGRSIVT